jgi:hypothetical protein
MTTVSFLLAILPHDHARLALQDLQGKLYRRFGITGFYGYEPLIPLAMSARAPAQKPLLPLAYRRTGFPPPEFTLGGAEIESSGIYLALADPAPWRKLSGFCERAGGPALASPAGASSGLPRPQPALLLGTSFHPDLDEESRAGIGDAIRLWLAEQAPDIRSWHSSRLALLQIEREEHAVRWQIMWRFALRSSGIGRG